MTRPSCIECTEKHLGAAWTLITETRDGYAAHRMRAIGHLHEAEDESQAWPELHNAIRDARKNYQHAGAVPDFPVLAELAAQVRATGAAGGALTAPGTGALPPITTVPPPVPGQPASVAPAGFSAVWASMPQLPSGGYRIEPGFYYRAAITVSGTASGVVTQSAVVNYLTGNGWDHVTVSPQALAGWPTPIPSGVAFFTEGRRTGPALDVPAQQSGGFWPVTATVSVVEALWFGYQPNGVPVPVPVVNTPGAPASAWKWVFGIAAASALAYGGYRLAKPHWRRWERNHRHA